MMNLKEVMTNLREVTLQVHQVDLQEVVPQVVEVVVVLRILLDFRFQILTIQMLQVILLSQ